MTATRDMWLTYMCEGKRMHVKEDTDMHTKAVCAKLTQGALLYAETV